MEHLVTKRSISLQWKQILWLTRGIHKPSDFSSHYGSYFEKWLPYKIVLVSGVQLIYLIFDIHSGKMITTVGLISLSFWILNRK